MFTAIAFRLSDQFEIRISEIEVLIHLNQGIFTFFLPSPNLIRMMNSNNNHFHEITMKHKKYKNNFQSVDQCESLLLRQTERVI